MQALQVLIAIQAGGSYGLGRMERCKTLAKALIQEHQAHVSFWVDTPNPAIHRELLQCGFSVIQNSWSLHETIRQGVYNRLVIDFQNPVTPTLIQRLRISHPTLPVMVINNNGLGCSEADGVVFSNVHSLPGTTWHQPGQPVYQGADYIVLGHNFLYGAEEDEPGSDLDRPTILITLGGRDPEQRSELLLEALQDLRDCHIDLIVPPAYPHPENLENIATRLPSTITLHWRVKSLRPLMARATLGITALGVTAYEFAFLGVPAMVMAHYQNQEDDLARFVHYGTAENLGWGKTLTPEHVYDQVTQLLTDEQRRNRMRQNGLALMNAEGSARMAELVLKTERIPSTSR